MNLQNLNNTVQSSSQTQEDALTNETLESSLAHLEMKTTQSKGIPFSPTKLKDIITTLENDLASGYWIIADYEDIDFKMMPALVKQANLKYPEMHLKFALTPHDLTLSLKEVIESGIQSSRYIVNTQERGNHFAVIDHRTIADKTSVILFESTTFMNNICATMLGVRTRQALQECQLPDCHFSMGEMDIQRSPSECGIFSLALAKKLYREAAKLTRMHEDNIRGVLCEPNTPLSSDKLDTYLPASFYKHTQGTRRLKQYSVANPAAENEKVNKKGETLVERLERNLVIPEDKTLSVSPHRKRISEYKSVLKL
ncbi:YopJ/AvrA family T3SS effector serine/threonine acetyltransferase [Bartonella heixiaziensis]|uniref:YopJ/AvrA family T3SS effector serine/threonine acetyltransferase n=1 Tax=Bartonella heixiaziensis TaxID=1461000 RepID=UPI00390890D7